jgi:hypothetical protein
LLNRAVPLVARSAMCVMAFAAASAAQSPPQRIEIGDAVACSRCSFSVALVATIGSEEDSMPISPMSAVAYDSRGRTFVAPLPSPVQRQRIHVYGPTGQVERVIGGPGQGPGEFTAVRQIAVGPGDSIFVVDITRRLTVFAPGGTPIRTGNTPYSLLEIEVLPDSRIVGASVSRQLNGVPLHLMDTRGALVRSFGVDPNGERNGSASGPTLMDIGRRISATRAGQVWSVNHATAELWDSAGQLRTVYRRKSPDLGLDPTQRPPGDRFPVAIADVVQGHPDTAWVSMLVQPRDPAPRARGEQLDVDKGVTTVVEIWDLKAGRVVARTRLPFAAWQTPAPGVVLRMRARDGYYVIEVWRLRLTQP